MNTFKNTYRTNHFASFVRLLGMFVLLVGGFTVSAKAQSTSMDSDLAFANEESVLDELAQGSVNPAMQNSAWWKSVRKEVTQSLRSGSEQEKIESMKNIIFFATYYKDKSDFSRSANDLYEIYRLDKNEAHRIMALAALNAIDNENINAQLAQDVRLERSDRVRKLTIAALTN